ncbi:MAG: ATP-dependent metallopeptidase FtsH/Yme1/Tma family protein, partial [Clostridiales bacterium]|nr:ATP-dependent metallopeptidase FtsH/Yme1/Tma family protein [Clostridiales bacterium]
MGRNNSWMMILAVLCMVVVVFLFYNMLFGGKGSTQTKPYTEFLEDLQNDRVESVELDAENAELTVTLKQEYVESQSGTESPDEGSNAFEQYAYFVQIKNDQVYTTRIMESMDTLTEQLEEHGVEGQRIVSTSSGLLTEIFVGVVLPVLVLWLLASFLMRKMGGGSGPLNVGKSNAKVYVQKETGVTFKDVAGEDEAKESLVEVVDFLHNPGKYSGIGARL